MGTGIKISSPATYSFNRALDNVLTFALTTPSVSIVFKPIAVSSDEIVLKGYKNFRESYIENSLAFLRSLSIFSKTPNFNLVVNNNIPFGLGLGADVACFSTLLKGLSVINKVSLTNRELYEIIVQSSNSILNPTDYTKFLSSMEGGSMFVNPKYPSLYQRIFLPVGLNFIIFYPNVTHHAPENLIDKDSDTLIDSLELLLGFSSTNWRMIKAGFGDPVSALKNLESDPIMLDQIINNSLGVNYNPSLNSYLIICQNSLETDYCLETINNIISNKKLKDALLFRGLVNNSGSKQY